MNKRRSRYNGILDELGRPVVHPLRPSPKDRAIRRQNITGRGYGIDPTFYRFSFYRIFLAGDLDPACSS